MSDKKPMLDADGKPVTLCGYPVHFSDKVELLGVVGDVVLRPLSEFHMVPPATNQPLADQGEGAPEWFCGCGGADPKRFLRDLLNAFAGENSCGSPYTDLAAFMEVMTTHSDSAVELVLYFLDHLGYVEHSGSVSSSAWLTAKGEELREWANR